MQTTTLKTSEVAPKARVVRISRSPAAKRTQRRHLVRSAAVYQPASKWTVVAAFIVAVALHAGAVMWVEMPQEKPPVEVGAPAPIDSVEKVTFQTGSAPPDFGYASSPSFIA
jgi:hypothetical protein